MFKAKNKVDGVLDKYKVRIFSQSYAQTISLDYNETYSLVVKAKNVRIMLTLALHFGWYLRQLDVNNVFLNDNLEEYVFMR